MKTNFIIFLTFLITTQALAQWSIEETESYQFEWKKLNKLTQKLTKEFGDHYVKKRLYHSIKIKNEARFCWAIEDLLNTYQVGNSSDLNYIYNTTFCKIEEIYFERSIKIPLYSSRKIKFQGINVNYKEGIGKNELKTIVLNGGAMAGCAAIHLAHMQEDDCFEPIYNLRNDENYFTQLVAIKGCKYFGEFEKAKKIASEIIEYELSCLKENKISGVGNHAYQAASALIEVYPEYALTKLVQLYSLYIKLYPEEYYTNSIKWFNENYNHETEKQSETLKRINSTNSAAMLIESEISKMLAKYPHWKNNEKVQFITNTERKRNFAPNSR